ncbi:MAG: tRNA pseudouridine(13) synthase TruD, partial [Candidatus Korarchaeota archaeon]|nr:tRNA pseudouridine(13) synthase TruD [Candidatus Korarchaeota archaeon]
SKGLQGRIEEQILGRENVLRENFKVNLLPETSLGGSLRTVTVPLYGFSSNEISGDNLNPERYAVKINFMLHRGSYATILLRELMKPTNIIESGF